MAKLHLTQCDIGGCEERRSTNLEATEGWISMIVNLDHGSDQDLVNAGFKKNIDICQKHAKDFKKLCAGGYDAA